MEAVSIRQMLILGGGPLLRKDALGGLTPSAR
ncbi:MAG: hypothetical protein RIQ83_1841 [Pseudomonadota bacterium]|jgi:hypothetical protein